MGALEPFDEIFLAQETVMSVGHSGALMLFDATGASAALTVEHLRKLVERELGQLPVLRRRPEPDPSNAGRHRWVEDEVVDLDTHVRGHRLEGGDDRALGRLVAHLNAPQLERSRPLWEWHVIEGLQDGRVATYLKFHHALGDAAPVRQVIETMFGADGEVEPVFAGGGKSTPPPPEETAAANPRPTARPMRFNQPLSAERDFAFASFPRARIEQIRSASATTFTDVLLAAWAGALRAWLALRGETPTAPLVARLPVSRRRPDDAQGPGNRMVVAAVAVPADLSSAEARLRYAHQEMMRAKQVGRSGPWFLETAARVNFSLSTLVGSNRPIAWDGAACLGAFPLTMLNITGLSIGCQTVPSEVRVGVHVDAEQIADPSALVRAFDLALAELEAVTGN